MCELQASFVKAPHRTPSSQFRELTRHKAREGGGEWQRERGESYIVAVCGLCLRVCAGRQERLAVSRRTRVKGLSPGTWQK